MSRNAKPSYSYQLLHLLAKGGEIRRITKSMYTFSKDIRVVGFAYSPFYYGLEDALTLRGIWDQGSNPVIVTSRRIRNGVREFGGRNYVLHRINKAHFFGYDLMKIGDLWIPVSDAEKTLIDLLYFRHNIGGEVLANLKKTLDRKRLEGYLKSYDRRLAMDVFRKLKD